MVAAGLGDFCLKISNTAVRKSEVISDIKKRLNISKVTFNESNYKNEKLKEEEVKNKLIEYKEILHANIGNSGIKVSDISGLTSKFSAISKSKIYLEIFNNELDKLGQSFEKITEDKFLLIISNLKNSEDSSNKILKKYGSIAKHPWSGFKNIRINPYDKSKIIEQFTNFRESIDEIENKIKIFTDSNPTLKIFNKVNCLDQLEKITSEKIENVEKIDQYINLFKSESDLKSIKDFEIELGAIQNELKIENKTKAIFKIKVSDFKKIKDIKDIISNSNFLSPIFPSYRNAKKEYLSITKDHIYFEKSKAISNLNQYFFSYVSILKPSINMDKRWDNLRTN